MSPRYAHHQRCTRRRSQDRRGALTVEFAMVVPLIFLLFFGSIELTALNLARQTAGNACYEGARKMIIPGGTQDAARTEALRQMSLAGFNQNVTVDVTETATSVNVAVSVPASAVSWGMTQYCLGRTIRQSCTLTKE